MKTKRELVAEWQGWTLTIPAGTPVEKIANNASADSCPIVARPSFLAPDLRTQAERPHSLFKHDAKYRYVWVSAEDCEP
jgi:hypothetical protein